MRFDILTLFPEMLEATLSVSILGRAQSQGLFEAQAHNIRDWGLGRHKQVDDYPYGGGAGMVFRPEPLFACLEAVLELPEPISLENPLAVDFPVVLLSPQGERFTQQIAQELANHSRIVLVCGHYEGFDERIARYATNRELSIGDYVLTGGELAALVIVDAVARLKPGVLAEESPHEESHTRPLLEYPHYTRPAEFRGWKVPDMLVSGHHAKVAEWRFKESLRRTLQRRPDLLTQIELELDKKERKLLAQVRQEEAERLPASTPIE
jgi:tRNA (guanine37-N1)-methyltransferase